AGGRPRRRAPARESASWRAVWRRGPIRPRAPLRATPSSPLRQQPCPGKRVMQIAPLSAWPASLASYGRAQRRSPTKRALRTATMRGRAALARNAPAAFLLLLLLTCFALPTFSAVLTSDEVIER